MKVDYNNLLNSFLNSSQNIVLHLLLMVIIFDVLTGLCKAYSTGSISSSIGLKGLLKHSIIFLISLTMLPYMELLNYGKEADIIVMFFSVNYIISIIENLDAIGIKLPKVISKKLLNVLEKRRR